MTQSSLPTQQPIISLVRICQKTSLCARSCSEVRTIWMTRSVPRPTPHRLPSPSSAHRSGVCPASLCGRAPSTAALSRLWCAGYASCLRLADLSVREPCSSSHVIFIEAVASRTGGSKMNRERLNREPHLAQCNSETTRPRAKNRQLQAQQVQLTRQLGGSQEKGQLWRGRLSLESRNSGRSPSSDGPTQPPTAWRPCIQQRRSGRHSGRQPRRQYTALRQTDTPDWIEVRPQGCNQCGEAFSEAVAELRQICDLTAPEPGLTKQPAPGCRCPRCSQLTRAVFPDGVTAVALYGLRIEVMPVYIQNVHSQLEDQLLEVFRNLVGGLPCTATPAGMRRMAVRYGLSWVKRIRDRPVNCDGVKPLDKTGFRVAGWGHWLHELTEARLTDYRTSPQRGAVPARLCRILVQDRWASYCNVPTGMHSIRKANHWEKKLETFTKVDREGRARRMRLLWRSAKRVADYVGEYVAAIPQSQFEKLDGRHEKLMPVALGYHKRWEPLRPGRAEQQPGHYLDLPLRLEHGWATMLGLLRDPRVQRAIDSRQATSEPRGPVDPSCRCRRWNRGPSTARGRLARTAHSPCLIDPKLMPSHHTWEITVPDSLSLSV